MIEKRKRARGHERTIKREGGQFRAGEHRQSAQHPLADQHRITYDTPPDKIDKAVAVIRQTLTDHEGMHPDFPPRVYFNGFNDRSQNIMVLIWYHPPNYWHFQEWVQRTCLEITR